MIGMIGDTPDRSINAKRRLSHEMVSASTAMVAGI